MAGGMAVACTLGTLLIPLIAAATAAPASGQSADREVARVKVEIEGVRGGVRENVESLLSIRRSREEEGLTAARLRQLHGRAPEEIVAAVEPFGYYRPTVRSELTPRGDAWTARYRIDPGPRMRLERVDVEVTGPGAEDPGFEERARAFPLAAGDPLSHAAYEEGKQALIDYAADNGYLDAEMKTAEIRVDLERYSSQVVIRLASGPRYRFGEVRFHQQVLDRRVLAGYVPFERGEPITIGPLLELQDALSATPYFDRVEVTVEHEEAVDLEAPVVVELMPAARQKWDLGVGFGTDTGPRGRVGLELRRLNRHGHRAQGELMLSEIEKSFTARYLVPAYYPSTNLYTFDAGYSELTTDTSTSETVLLGGSRTRQRGRWREELGLTFQRADFEVGVDSGVSELLIPQASWTQVRADDRIYVRRGHRLQLTLRGAEESVISDSTFLQIVTDAKAIRPLNERLRLIGRLGAGYTWTSDFRRLPPTVRFFAGGDQSVRGYDFQTLGPLDVEGNVIGGEALATASVELDSLFLDFGTLGRWGAAVFYDVGGAAETIGDRLEQGTGVGLRWLSPIGLVRADVAWAVSEPGTPIRFHLMIGPDL